MDRFGPERGLDVVGLEATGHRAGPAVSDLGIATMTGNDGLNVVIHALSNAGAVAGVDLKLIAADNDIVTALNRRAHDDLAAARRVQPGGVPLADGTMAAAGGRIITRRIDRHLADDTPSAPAPPQRDVDRRVHHQRRHLHRDRHSRRRVAQGRGGSREVGDAARRLRRGACAARLRRHHPPGARRRHRPRRRRPA